MNKVACLGVVACVFAVIPPSTVAQKVGSTSMQFLKVMPVARATSLGDAFTVWASGAEAVFWNPGGVAQIEDHQLSTTYVNWIFDAKQGALSYALPMGDIGALGFQVQYVDFGIFEETTNALPYIKNIDFPGMTGNTFRPFGYLIGVVYARSLTDKFSTGIGIKYAHESLFDGRLAQAMVATTGAFESVSTWADALLFDFGIRYTTGFRTIQVGASVQNFGANVKYARESSPAPLMFRFGIAADLVGEDGLLVAQDDNRVGLAADLFHPNDYDQQLHMGMEYEFAGVFSLRGGYKFNYDTEGLTAGAGVKHTLGSVALSLDYSYGSVGTYLGSAHRISLGAIIQ